MRINVKFDEVANVVVSIGPFDFTITYEEAKKLQRKLSRVLKELNEVFG